ncbi:MAG: hypothetical protein IPN48_08205 [Sphingomonadales bacterium]|nr:hypothetical protein [Sphingomonadales bacterium]
MSKGRGEKSYFHDFGLLFGAPGAWSKVTPLIGFRFIGMAGYVHRLASEVVNNLVIVLSGALELGSRRRRRCG